MLYLPEELLLFVVDNTWLELVVVWDALLSLIDDTDVLPNKETKNT